MRRIVAAATSLCILLAGTSLPARAAGNSPPVAVDDPGPACGSLAALGGSYPVTEDWHDWSLLALGCAPLVNDTDPDGDPLSVELVGQPAHGEAEVIPGTPTDWLQYRPEHDYSTGRGDEPGGSWLSDEITYRAFDGQAYSNEAKYRLWVAPVNDPPSFTPGPDLIETQAGDGPVSVQWATDVSPGPANESDQSVHFEIYVSAPDDLFEVKPTIDDDGVLTFTPGTTPWLATVYVYAQDDGGLEDWNFPPSAPFDYPDDTSAQVTFEIAIHPAPPAPPVAVDDNLTMLEDTPGHVSVIGNDTDINGDNLALTAVGAAGKGTATIHSPGSWQVDYVPTPDANGSDSFSYTVSDTNGGTDTGTVHVTITPVNDDPEATDDEITVAQGAAGVEVTVLDNDDDVDGDTLTVSGVGIADHGTTDVTGGVVTYTPAAGYTGPDGFDYTVSDGAGGHATASVTVDVSPDAVPPVVTQLRAAIAAGAIGTSIVPGRLSWQGADAVTGIAGFELQRRSGSHWVKVELASPVATSVELPLAVGSAARFRIRATDGAGNRSAFAEWASLDVRRPQERSGAINWTGTWHAADDARYSGGHARHASVHSRRATFAFTGHAIGLVSRRSPSGGHADVRIDGVKVATIDLSASTVRYRRIVFRNVLASGGPHTIEIRPVGDGRVDIDAFIVLD